jgi:hypothetical protein
MRENAEAVVCHIQYVCIVFISAAQVLIPSLARTQTNNAKEKEKRKNAKKARESKLISFWNVEHNIGLTD